MDRQDWDIFVLSVFFLFVMIIVVFGGVYLVAGPPQ